MMILVWAMSQYLHIYMRGRHQLNRIIMIKNINTSCIRMLQWNLMNGMILSSHALKLITSSTVASLPIIHHHHRRFQCIFYHFYYNFECSNERHNGEQEKKKIIPIRTISIQQYKICIPIMPQISHIHDCVYTSINK